MYTTCLHCWYCDFKKAISSLDIRKSCTPFYQLHGYTLHLSVKDFLYMVALIHSFTKLPKDHIYSKPCGHAFILQLDLNKKNNWPVTLSLRTPSIYARSFFRCCCRGTGSDRWRGHQIVHHWPNGHLLTFDKKNRASGSHFSTLFYSPFRSCDSGNAKGNAVLSSIVFVLDQNMARPTATYALPIC